MINLIHHVAEYRPLKKLPPIRDLMLLLYWPVYIAMFLRLEKINVASRCHVIHCPLDDLIPFCEYFVIPYLLWFLLLGWLSVYTILREPAIYRRFMHFIIFTYTVALLTYLIWPTCLQLRPATLPRQNAFSALMRFIYRADTSTNVCPSIHVLGTMGFFYASRELTRMQSNAYRLFFSTMCMLICMSTVFLRQHSIIDVFVALALGQIGWMFCFRQNHLTIHRTAPS